LSNPPSLLSRRDAAISLELYMTRTCPTTAATRCFVPGVEVGRSGVEVGFARMSRHGVEVG